MIGASEAFLLGSSFSEWLINLKRAAMGVAGPSSSHEISVALRSARAHSAPELCRTPYLSTFSYWR